jgi:hypothetical protein
MTLVGWEYRKAVIEVIEPVIHDLKVTEHLEVL